MNRKLREAAGADAGDVVTLELAPDGGALETHGASKLFRRALAAAPPKARALWADITTIARRDWIRWISSARQERRVGVGSKMPARCSPAGSDAFAASIALGSIVSASALLKRRFRRRQVCGAKQIRTNSFKSSGAFARFSPFRVVATARNFGIDVSTEFRCFAERRCPGA